MFSSNAPVSWNASFSSECKWQSAVKHAAMTNLTAIAVCMPEIYHEQTLL